MLRRSLVALVLVSILLAGVGCTSVEVSYRVLATSRQFNPLEPLGPGWSYIPAGTPGAPNKAAHGDSFFTAQGTIYLVEVVAVYNRSQKTFQFDPSNLYMLSPEHNNTWLPAEKLAGVSHLAQPVEVGAGKRVWPHQLLLIGVPTKWGTGSATPPPALGYVKKPFEPNQDHEFDVRPYGNHTSSVREILIANSDTESLLKQANQK